MSAILRQTARSAFRVRQFSTAHVSRKDFVQELYLKELKAYQPAPAAKDAHVGAVKTFSAPSPPQAPSLPSDLASELSSYDSAEPVGAASAAPAATPTSTGQTDADAFLAFLEADEPKHDNAHH